MDATLDGLADRLGMAAYPARSCFRPAGGGAGPPAAAGAARRPGPPPVPPRRRPGAGRHRRGTADRAEHAPVPLLGRAAADGGGLARRAAAYRGELALLAGDLNTLEPAVDHTARLAGLATAYRRRHLRRDGRTVDTRAVARLLDAGLVDLWPRSGGDEPGGLTVPTRHGGAEFAGMRLDYLLATPRWPAGYARCGWSATVTRTRPRTTIRCWPRWTSRPRRGRTPRSPRRPGSPAR
ncbi:hypothetical protein V2I01_24845 [Micromonospora sp. BRA006-A]|nr:hypothetical protein [Micromonospora sp. BRA006-A]